MNADFRQIDRSQVDEAYAAYLGVFEWLNAKGVRQWLRALPHEEFLERERKGELFACYIDQKIAAIVTLAFEAGSYWADEMGSDARWWIKTLAVVRTWRGAGVGTLAMRGCEARVWGLRAPEVFLDCVDAGFLPGYYAGLGYTVLARKDITYLSGYTFPVALMTKEKPSQGLQPMTPLRRGSS